MAKVAPSLLSADFSRLGDEVRSVAAAGADLIHFDVMDGNFVPNITFGPMVLAAIRGATTLPFEAHLMIEDPVFFWKKFVDAGADAVGIHIENDIDHKGLICEIAAAGVLPYLVINPPTPIERLEPLLEFVPQVLVMTVNPGFGGQAFIPETLGKIERLAQLRRGRGLSFLIEVDGGINEKTAPAVRRAGADILVAGSYIFESDNYAARIESIR